MMRVLGLLLLLAGTLLLLWPHYGYLLHGIRIARADTQTYGGALLLAGVAALVASLAQTRR